MKFFISCGELSGDLHAANLVRELKKLLPEAEFKGFGGPNLAKEGVDIKVDIKEMSVVGFAEVLKYLPKALKQMKIAKRTISTCDACIFVDYPGFNLRLLPYSKKTGKINIYYILPQVWAWGESRINKLKKYCDLLISIIPFEKDFFKKYNVEVNYVGNPVYDKFLEISKKVEKIQVPEGKIPIGILPGSRRSEVEKLLPHLQKIIKILKNERKDLFFIMSRKVPFDFTEEDVAFWDGSPYPIMESSKILLVASGTATLETALFEKPMVVLYKTSPLTYFIGKTVAKVKNISLVNLLLNEEVVPEFIQKIDEKKIARFILDYLDNEHLYDSTANKLKNLKTILKPEAASNAARLIFEEVIKHGYA
jgi:lipid-A-disaccharide synthase